MEQLPLWEEQQEEEREHWIQLIHYDGKRELVSTLDTTTNWREDMTVWSAQFITKEPGP